MGVGPPHGAAGLGASRGCLDSGEPQSLAAGSGPWCAKLALQVWPRPLPVGAVLLWLCGEDTEQHSFVLL